MNAGLLIAAWFKQTEWISLPEMKLMKFDWAANQKQPAIHQILLLFNQFSLKSIMNETNAAFIKSIQ